MPVRSKVPFYNGIYFLTFTCYNWLSLLQKTNAYDLVYKWFDCLKESGSYIIGYVIMPNHLHAVIAFSDNEQSINTQVGNGKRFLAYGIVEQLKEQNDQDILAILEKGVNATDRKRGKLHAVFKASFDCKECFSDKMLKTKLDYMHRNPCRGKWDLVNNPIDYIHSSAKYYYTGEQGYYPVTHYLEIRDIDLNKMSNMKMRK